MIKFEASKKTLESYVEMGVKFNQGEKGEPFESIDELWNAAVKSGIKSSSNCDYSNQEAEWRKLATKHGYDGLKDLATNIAKLMESGVSYGFPGLEGLAALTNNPELMDKCDYGNAGSADQLLTSMFYGGNRMKQWKKYAKPYITPRTFIDELHEADGYGTLFTFGLDHFEEVNNNTIKVYFLSTENEQYPKNTEESKKEFHKMLEQGDELFDFSIIESFESDVWTITVK